MACCLPSVSVGSGLGILCLLTISLLWAFEKDGYGRLVLDAAATSATSSASKVPGIDIFLGFGEEGAVDGAVDAGSRSDELRLEWPWEDRRDEEEEDESGTT